MTPANKAKIKAFVEERNAVLLTGDIEKVRTFFVKHNPQMRVPDDGIFEMAIHKARTAAKALPIEARLASKRWLSERGLQSMDDGNLTN